MHIGGDEVNLNCWKENSNIQNWLVEQGHPGDMQWLEGYFHRRMRQITKDMSHKTFIFWEESNHFAEQMNNSAVQTWKWPR
jgi:N-acetyl-beta-hexosaminidase